MEELAAWMWLSDSAESLTGDAVRLLAKFGSPEKISLAEQSAVAQIASKALADALRRNRSRYEGPEAKLRLADFFASGGDLLTLNDPAYPQHLRGITSPPLLLFRKGTLREFDRTVAVIGTRSPTHRGYTMARTIGAALAGEGYCVVSGLARGIDTLAHCGALDAGGKTAALLPGPITFLYPPENVFLAEDIVRNGALLAENSPMVSIDRMPYSQKYRWVKRNRITSGLSEALVVVEATDSGGSMHQVKFAVGQGRPIHVLKPDDIVPAPLRRGYEEAVASGARPFTSVDDLMAHLPGERPERQGRLD